MVGETKLNEALIGYVKTTEAPSKGEQNTLELSSRPKLAPAHLAQAFTADFPNNQHIRLAKPYHQCFFFFIFILSLYLLGSILKTRELRNIA